MLCDCLGLIKVEQISEIKLRIRARLPLDVLLHILMLTVLQIFFFYVFTSSTSVASCSIGFVAISPTTKFSPIFSFGTWCLFFLMKYVALLFRLTGKLVHNNN